MGNTLKTSDAIRFGSSDSIDRDVVYVVDSLPDFHQCKSFCDGTDENRNLISVVDGVVSECYKGLPDEMNNALLSTSCLHQQTVPLPVTTQVNRIVPLKVARTIRVILSLCSHSQYRPQIKTALRSQNFAERRDLLAKIDLTTVELSNDAAKSIAFQLGQTIALIDGNELFTKSEVSDFCQSLRPLIDRNPSGLSALNEQRDRLIEQLAGVYVRQKDSLNIFCYENGPAIRDWNQFASQSRGMVLDLKKERCVYYPFDKFFQVDEVPQSELDRLPRHLPTEIVEKVDGSMVSCFRNNGGIEFHCKGNFDVQQSLKALEISKHHAMDQLDFDRHWHVFEVVYPRNRFPHGLCVTDYGDREAIILTGLRDRQTNTMLPYADVVAEAQRVGLPHPVVFDGDFTTAIHLTSQEQSILEEEGFVARFEDGQYVKIKYPAYKVVLRLVNDMKSKRFIKRFVGLTSQERAATLEILPKPYRAVATEQLQEFGEVFTTIEDYFRTLVRDHETKFPRYVLDNVPQEFHKPLFGFWRGSDYQNLLEKLALKVQAGKVELPSY